MAETLTIPSSEQAELPSWNRPRTTSELLGFIARREATLEGVEL